MTKAKRRIKDASYELFREKDFDSISIKDILDRASVCKGTFYNNFADKYELLYMYCADLLSETVLSAYDGHNWDELQEKCFALGQEHRQFFRGLRDASGVSEFWHFIHCYFARIFRNIRLCNTGESELTSQEQLTIDTYVNAVLYIFRKQVLFDYPVSYGEISEITSRSLPDDYKVIDDPEADPASVIITDTEELIGNIYRGV